MTTAVASQMMMHVRCIRHGLKKSKHNIKVMAVMFMDNLIDRFDMTTLGAAKEVGLLLGHNDKTICTWQRDFYNNGGHFTESLQGKHSRLR